MKYLIHICFVAFIALFSACSFIMGEKPEYGIVRLTHKANLENIGEVGTLVKHYDFSSEKCPAKICEGLYNVEGSGRWMSERAIIFFHVRKHCQLTMRIEFEPFIFGDLKENKVVLIAGRNRLPLTIDHTHKVFYVHIQEEDVANENVIWLQLEAENPTTPHSLGLSEDTRLISCGLKSVTVYGYYTEEKMQ